MTYLNHIFSLNSSILNFKWRKSYFRISRNYIVKTYLRLQFFYRNYISSSFRFFSFYHNFSPPDHFSNRRFIIEQSHRIAKNVRRYYIVSKNICAAVPQIFTANRRSLTPRLPLRMESRSPRVSSRG